MGMGRWKTRLLGQLEANSFDVDVVGGGVTSFANYPCIMLNSALDLSLCDGC